MDLSRQNIGVIRKESYIQIRIHIKHINKQKINLFNSINRQSIFIKGGNHMEIYVDTADSEHIQFAARFPFIDGITTNPSIIAKESEAFQMIIERINQHIDGKILMQVTESKAHAMYQQAIELKNWVKHPVVKLPMNEEGLEAAYRLRQENIEVNMTLIYSLSQVILAAKADI